MSYTTVSWLAIFIIVDTNDPKTNVKGGTEAGLYEMLQEYMIENESLRWVTGDRIMA